MRTYLAVDRARVGHVIREFADLELLPPGNPTPLRRATRRANRGPLTRIEDADAPNLMVNDEGDRFYPDNPEDAAYFAEHHGATWASGPPEWLTPSSGTANDQQVSDKAAGQTPSSGHGCEPRS